MKITIVGTGYVGLVNGVSLAHYGHNVTLFDVDKEKISRLNQGIVPIYEPGLEELIIKNKERLVFTTNEAVYKNPGVLFIGVGTPEREDGSADLKYLNAVIDSLIKYLEQDAVVIIKSTVPVGTNTIVKCRLEKELTRVKVHIVSNPEFLAQGQAVNDALYPKRIVVGTDSPKARKIMEEIYAPYQSPVIFTDLVSSELSKYVCNNILALKISFMNEIAALSEAVGSDIEQIKTIMTLDPRIGNSFLNPGTGYGGSCFPKDTIALAKFAKQDYDLDLDIVNAGIKRNKSQKNILVKKALERFSSLSGKTVLLLGLTFKPGTDDLREAPSLTQITSLLKINARVLAYDPLLAKINKHQIDPRVELFDDPILAIKEADMIFILNDTKNFTLQDLAGKIVFDGRNNYRLNEVALLKEYHSIGRVTVVND